MEAWYLGPCSVAMPVTGSGAARWRWLVGVEYRQKPDNLDFADEDDWWDLFVAWVPDRHLAVTAAWVNLGDIAGLENQQGAYLALQGSF